MRRFGFFPMAVSFRAYFPMVLGDYFFPAIRFNSIRRAEKDRKPKIDSSAVLRTATCWPLGRARTSRMNAAWLGQCAVSMGPIGRCAMGCSNRARCEGGNAENRGGFNAKGNGEGGVGRKRHKTQLYDLKLKATLFVDFSSDCWYRQIEWKISGIF